jgi:Zn-dependent protease with chaperone function
MERRITWAYAIYLAAMVALAGAAAAYGQANQEEPKGIRSDHEIQSSRGELDAELVPVDVPQPSEKALRYYRTGMWLWAFNECWALILPGLIVFSGLSARLRDVARRISRGLFASVGLSRKTPEAHGEIKDPALVWFLTIGFYIVSYLGLVFVIELPLAYYQGFVRQHAYGLSNQTLAKWSTDNLLRLAVEMVVGFAFAWIPYLLLARAPRRWWLYTTLLSVPFLFGTVLLKPIWIDPLFNDFGPMKNKTLERSILELAGRAGIEGSRVYEVNKSVDTKAVNAYVTGLFQTKRIVLWDTLLARLEEKEVLAVMAHEMGHYVLGHLVRSILLSSIATLIGLFLVDRIGRFLIDRYPHQLRFNRLSDIASVPLILMLIEFTSLFLTPAVFAYSRYQEHEADRFAIDLTRSNHSAATAFVKLQEENLSNPRPGLIYTVFRATHPSIGQRIDFCNAYRPDAGSRP